MRNNTNAFIILIFLSAVFSGCSPLFVQQSKYFPLTDKKYAPNSPCDIKLIASNLLFQEVRKEHILINIGTCVSELNTGKNNKNKAMEDIYNCGCENGGDYIFIVQHDEKIERQDQQSTVGTLNTRLIFKGDPEIKSDYVVGELYKIKE